MNLQYCQQVAYIISAPQCEENEREKIKYLPKTERWNSIYFTKATQFNLYFITNFIYSIHFKCYGKLYLNKKTKQQAKKLSPKIIIWQFRDDFWQHSKWSQLVWFFLEYNYLLPLEVLNFDCWTNTTFADLRFWQYGNRCGCSSGLILIGNIVFFFIIFHEWTWSDFWNN